MVEEWKKATAEYKAAAIPLGRFDNSEVVPVQNSPYASQAPSQTDLRTDPRHVSSGSNAGGSDRRPLYRPEQDAHLPPGDFTLLAVPSFHNESGNYWFRLQVTFVPDDPTGPAYTLSLYRTYEDFYDFQISLLDTFPYEAGRPRSGAGEDEVPERILPYMPGPVDDAIDDELTEYRREELDLYVKALVDLRARGAGYIIRHELFRGFFAAKYGDYCEEVPRENAVEELEERLAEIKVNDDRSSSRQTGRDDRAASAASRHSQPSSQWSGGHGRQGSSSRNSPLPPPVDTSRPTSSSQGHYISGGPSTGLSTTSSFTAPQPSATTPGANGVPNLPGAQPPYIKIKIYDRSTDDLIALRVHPNVSHGELFEKVRARLGPEINVLRFRTSMTGPQAGAYREIGNDKDLRDWMRTEDQKLVLYAEQ
ncbi:Phox homologous domain-containing protein [Papiliotrema laurentii]|uniref:Phox homologous domain-containing protein n=1 Tax=Papiliotrema laurentii TaxID=5418 RepID=A0AAD9FU41_PAPLA|nr:Phox homologous domain-containing protein [Papiliotrema laurentii]